MDSPNTTAATVFGKTNRSTLNCCYIRTFEKFSLGNLGCSRNLVLQGSISSVTVHNCNLTFKVIFPGSGTAEVVKYDKCETLHVFVGQKQTNKTSIFTLKFTEIHPIVERHCCGFGDCQMLSCDFSRAFSVKRTAY